MTRAGATISIAFVLLSVAFLGQTRYAAAATASEIQSQIDQNNQQLTQLQDEIAQYQTQLDALGAKHDTLQSAVNQLALSQRQLATKIKATQNQIDSANLQIDQLTSSIGDKEQNIKTDQDAIAQAMRDIDQGAQQPLFISILAAQSLSDAWQAADHAVQFNRALESDIRDLVTSRIMLANNRSDVAAKEKHLESLQSDLSLQKRSVDASKAAQQKLLSETKNQESNYQKLIADKKASEKAFEQQLIDLQSQLNLIVNPGSLPPVGKGVLQWPFSLAFMQHCASEKSRFGNLYCITQYFGNTPFATKNPQIYSGHGHDGIDIAAPIGTPVHAALAGTILDTGDTDLVHDYRGHQCWSFGKWVMIKHGDGLNTMYAHLSEIDVKKGQSVQTGQVIGLSGMTGYATGPHLHFGVYATDGTEIMTLRQFRGATIGCADARMPVAKLDAYLNPLSYL